MTDTQVNLMKKKIKGRDFKIRSARCMSECVSQLEWFNS
jgi:hypothetical protein